MPAILLSSAVKGGLSGSVAMIASVASEVGWAFLLVHGPLPGQGWADA